MRSALVNTDLLHGQARRHRHKKCPSVNATYPILLESDKKVVNDLEQEKAIQKHIELERSGSADCECARVRA